MGKLVYVFAALVALVWLWKWLRGPRPVFPPLVINDDDPLMLEAVRKAQGSLETFRALYLQPHKGARLKVPFITSSGARELLWSDVKRLGERDADVVYLTPPVTHTGRVDRTQTHALAEAVDWQIELGNGNFRGGFTMLVMFIRGREQWGSLPAELEAEERRYVHEV